MKMSNIYSECMNRNKARGAALADRCSLFTLQKNWSSKSCSLFVVEVSKAFWAYLQYILVFVVHLPMRPVFQN